MDRRSRGPPDHLTGEQINDHREVEPPLPRPDVRDVRCPGRVAFGRRELTLEKVRGQYRRLADLLPARAIAGQRPEPVLPHEAGHAMLATRLARLPEIKEHAWRPEDAPARLERRANPSEQPRVLHRPRRPRAPQPLGVPTGRNAELAAHDLRGELPSMGLDELVLPANAICSGLRWHGRFLSLRRLTLAPSAKVW